MIYQQHLPNIGVSISVTPSKPIISNYSAMTDTTIIHRFKGSSTWLDRVIEKLRANLQQEAPSSNGSQKEPGNRKKGRPRKNRTKASRMEMLKTTEVLSFPCKTAFTNDEKTAVELKYVNLNLLDEAPLVMGTSLSFIKGLSDAQSFTLTPIYTGGKKGPSYSSEIGSFNKGKTLWNFTYPEDWVLGNLIGIEIGFKESLIDVPDGGAWILIENLD